MPLLQEDTEIFDVGSGVGIPGLPVALSRPDNLVRLIEPRKQCIALIRWIAEKLPPISTELVQSKYENLSFESSSSVQIISRAAIGWESYYNTISKSIGPIIRWSGPDVEYPHSQSNFITILVTVEAWALNQEFIWWGSNELFHVKQKQWKQSNSISFKIIKQN